MGGGGGRGGGGGGGAGGAGGGGGGLKARMETGCGGGWGACWRRSCRRCMRWCTPTHHTPLTLTVSPSLCLPTAISLYPSPCLSPSLALYSPSFPLSPTLALLSLASSLSSSFLSISLSHSCSLSSYSSLSSSLPLSRSPPPPLSRKGLVRGCAAQSKPKRRIGPAAHAARLRHRPRCPPSSAPSPRYPASLRQSLGPRRAGPEPPLSSQAATESRPSPGCWASHAALSACKRGLARPSEG